MSRKKEMATVLSQEMLAEGIFSLWLETSAAAEAKPGQFLSIYTNDGTKLLPRPISICEIDKEKGALRMVYRVTGEKTGTKQFSELKAGDQIPVIGPMGKVLRKIMPKAYILVPGYGAQGGKGKDLVHFFNEDGLGAIVNSSRGIIAAYKQEQYAKFGAENFGDASRAAVEAMIADIGGALNNR